MGQGACTGYLKHQSPLIEDCNNNSAMELQKIAALEEKLRQKDAEIQGLQVVIINH